MIFREHVPLKERLLSVIASARQSDNGNFPIDLNGINEDGFTQVGTPLDKANMLTDELANSVGLDGNATLLSFLTVLANLLMLTDEATGDRFLMRMSVTDDGFPALTLTQVS